MSNKRLFVASMLFVFAVAACGKSDGGDQPKPVNNGTGTGSGTGMGTGTGTGTGTAVTPPVGGKGTITGKIAFEGDAPKMDALPRQSDPVCAKTPMNSVDVVVANGAVKDVLVRLPVGAAKGAAPATPVEVDQKNCMYEPHVFGLVSGQKVTIKNTDGTTHNVHSYVGDETKFNEAQPAGSADLTKDIEAEAGDVLHLKCDVHAWMESFGVVTDHPYFAVSGDDGSFKIADAPAGKYTLEAWHPKMGVKTVEVTVEDGKTVEAKFPAFTPADYKK